MSEEEPQVVTERRDAVLVVRINRPDARNALNPAVMGGVGNALAQADGDADIRAVVLTGTGDKAFCAGMDLRAFAGGGMQPTEDEQRGMQTFMRFFGGEGVETPVIGAAQATALAGGLELLLACDLVVAAAGVNIGLPEVKRGLFAAGGGMYLARRIPLAKALELTLTGEPITTEEAAALGLVNQVVPAAEVVDTAVALAEKVASNGPLGVQASKKLVRAAAFEPLAEVRAMHGELQGKVFGSEDAKEGATAFVEKRPSVWRGR